MIWNFNRGKENISLLISVLTCDQSSSSIISHQWLLCYMLIKWCNILVLHWQEMESGENWSHASSCFWTEMNLDFIEFHSWPALPVFSKFFPDHITCLWMYIILSFHDCSFLSIKQDEFFQLPGRKWVVFWVILHDFVGLNW